MNLYRLKCKKQLFENLHISDHGMSMNTQKMGFSNIQAQISQKALKIIKFVLCEFKVVMVNYIWGSFAVFEILCIMKKLGSK